MKLHAAYSVIFCQILMQNSPCFVNPIFDRVTRFGEKVNPIRKVLPIRERFRQKESLYLPDITRYGQFNPVTDFP